MWKWRNYAVSTKTAPISQHYLYRQYVHGSEKSRFVGDEMQNPELEMDRVTVDARNDH